MNGLRHCRVLFMLGIFVPFWSFAENVPYQISLSDQLNLKYDSAVWESAKANDLFGESIIAIIREKKNNSKTGILTHNTVSITTLSKYCKTLQATYLRQNVQMKLTLATETKKTPALCILEGTLGVQINILENATQAYHLAIPNSQGLTEQLKSLTFEKRNSGILR